MGESFKGWRRKIGVVTLVMACAFAAAWNRSRNTFERVRFDMESIGFGFTSEPEGISCGAYALPRHRISLLHYPHDFIWNPLKSMPHAGPIAGDFYS